MKRLLFSVLALAALVACNKNEVLETVSPDAITFEGAWVDNATRSLDPSFTNQPGATNGNVELTEIDVYGFMTEATGVVFDRERVTKQGADNWTYVNTQYWTPNRDYYFAAFAPVDADWMLEKATGDDAKFGAGVLTFTQDATNPGTEDLIYSAVKVKTPNDITNPNAQPGKVQFIFNHLLSKVKFSFTNGFNNDNATVKVTNIKMIVPAKGSIDLAQKDWWTTNEWELEDATTTLAFGNMEDAKLARGSKTESQYERLTFPTDATYEYLVSFDVELYYGDQLAYSNSLTTSIKDAALQIGKSYNFHATINNENIAPGNEKLHPIEFNVQEIKDWTPGNGYEGGVIKTNPVYDVVDVDDLLAAVADINTYGHVNPTVKLAGDITLADVKSETAMPCIVVEKDMTFDLGNYTITGGVFAESNGAITKGESDSYVFWVKKDGNLTIKGEGTVVAQDATYSMAVWAQNGGKVNIYGGTYKNGSEPGTKDGCDLIYASNGSEINIYGGTFIAAKDMLPGQNGTNQDYSALNLKGVANGVAKSNITVYGGKFYGYNPFDNKSENPAYNFVAPNYNVVKTIDATTQVAWYTVLPYEGTTLTESAAAVTIFNVKNNSVLDGAGKTLSIDEVGNQFLVSSTLRLINADAYATIKNLNIDGKDAKFVKDGISYGIRGIFITKPGEYTIEDVNFSNVTYTINDDGSQPKTLNIKNSTFEGWTSYNPGTVGNFTNVMFTVNNAHSYNAFAPHGNTTLTDCQFAEGFKMYFDRLHKNGKTVKFTNCTYNGVVITADNIRSFFPELVEHPEYYETVVFAFAD